MTVSIFIHWFARHDPPDTGRGTRPKRFEQPLTVALWQDALTAFTARASTMIPGNGTQTEERTDFDDVHHITSARLLEPLQRVRR